MTTKLQYSPDPSYLLGYDVGVVRKTDPQIRIRRWNDLVINPFSAEALNRGWENEETLEKFRQLGKEFSADLAKQFLNNNTRAKKKYIHLFISFSPADSPKFAKDDDLIERIALDVLKGLGLIENSWLMTEHLDTQNPHVHIAINRIKNGKAWTDSFSHLKCNKLNYVLNQKYNLSPPRPELQNPAKQSQATKDAEFIRAEIKAALKLALRWEAFVENLEARGLTVQISANGISFGRKGKDGGFKGYKLGFAYPKLRKMVDEAYTETIAATIRSTFEPLKKSIASTIVYFKDENNEGRIEGDAHEQFRKLSTCWHQVEQLKDAYESVNPCVADRLISAMNQALRQLIELLHVLAEQLRKWYRTDLKESSRRLKALVSSATELVRNRRIEDVEHNMETLDNSLTRLDKKQLVLDELESNLLNACHTYTGEIFLRQLKTNHIEVRTDASFELVTNKGSIRGDKILSPTVYNEVITSIKKALTQKAITPPHHRLGRHL